MTFSGRKLRSNTELQATIDHDLTRSHEGFDNLTAQLVEPLKDGTYSSILTDKRGGTLPALVVNGLAKRWATTSGSRAPAAIDLPGGKWWFQVDREKYIKKTRKIAGAKSLVVTEVLAGGEMSGSVYAGLSRGGIHIDVAAFQVYLNESDYKGPERWGVWGDTLQDMRLYYGIKSSSNDILNTPALVVARGFDEDPDQHPSEKYLVPEQAFLISAARKHLETLTDELYERYF